MSEQNEVDWEPLGEDVSTHTMLHVMQPHEDGRFCMYHSRLGAWVFGWPTDKRCLRNDHPAPYAQRTTPPTAETTAGQGGAG